MVGEGEDLVKISEQDSSELAIQLMDACPSTSLYTWRLLYDLERSLYLPFPK